MQEGQNNFREKHLYTTGPERHHVQELVRTKSRIFKKISKWVYITSFPFTLIPYPVSSLEKVAPFLRTAALNNQIALRCVQYEKVTEAELGLRSIVAESS